MCLSWQMVLSKANLPLLSSVSWPVMVNTVLYLNYSAGPLFPQCLVQTKQINDTQVNSYLEMSVYHRSVILFTIPIALTYCITHLNCPSPQLQNNNNNQCVFLFQSNSVSNKVFVIHYEWSDSVI